MDHLGCALPDRGYSTVTMVQGTPRFERRLLVRSLVLAVCLAFGLSSAAAAAPEDFGRFAVHMTQVSIPVPVDPGGPEGLLPSVNADVYVPVGGAHRPVVEI